MVMHNMRMDIQMNLQNGKMKCMIILNLKKKTIINFYLVQNLVINKKLIDNKYLKH